MRQDVANELARIMKKDVMLLNKSELARRLGCNRRTVDRYIKAEVNGLPPKPKREYQSKIDSYKSTIIDKVDTCGASAMAVYKFIQKKGYTGGYGLISNFVRKHKKSEQQKATIRFETTPGLQAQVDWKEAVKMISRQGRYLRLISF